MRMADDDSNRAIQAFPIHNETVKGLHTDLDVKKLNILHCTGDGDVTYTFNDDSTFVESLVTGEDRALGDSVKSITTTASCVVS